MRPLLFIAPAFAVLLSSLPAAEPAPATKPAAPAAKPPVKKIIPGQAIVPTDAMRRIWGELVSLDLTTRTGTFRKEGTDEIMPFTVLPYAELLHHAAFGDLQDFRIGTRALFRMHENEATGQWTWLTYIQDQMNMMNGHKEYFYVDAIDPAKGELTCTQANFDKSFVREKGILISTDAETKYWKQGQPATFADIKVGGKIRTETHGIGKGKTQMCWNVFLDDDSLKKFQDAQKAVHTQRMTEDGLPGYVDQAADKTLALTLFWEGNDLSHALKPGVKVRVAPAGVDRKPTAAPVEGTVTESKFVGPLNKTVLTLNAPVSGFNVGAVSRLWIVK